MKKFILLFLILVSLLNLLSCTKNTQTYTIEFENNNHGEKPNIITEVSNIPHQLPNLTEEGWCFEGWYFENTYSTKVIGGEHLTCNITLYAKWKQITYSVTYNINGHGIQPNSLFNVSNLPTELPRLTDNSWTFDGWYYDKEFQTKASALDTLNKDVILYAKWIFTSFTVTFNTLGYGVQPAPITNLNQLPDKLPILTCEGFNFEGWFYDSNFIKPANNNDFITSDVTLYAKWEEIQIDVPTPESFMISTDSTKLSVTNETITLLTDQLTSCDYLGDSPYIIIPVTDINLSNVYISLKYKTSNITGIGLHIKGNINDVEQYGYVASISPIGWNVKNEYFNDNITISTANITSYLKEYSSLDYLIIKLQGYQNSSLEILDYEITLDGNYSFSTPYDKDFVYTNFTTSIDSPITISTNNNNEQVLTYSSKPGWYELESKIYNYETNYSKLEFEFTSSHEVTLCFATKVDNKEEQHIAHTLYPAGYNLITIDMNLLPTDNNFTLRVYVDAKVDVNVLKTLTIHSYKFIDPNNIEIESDTIRVTYTESIDTFANPDQGFYNPISIVANRNGVETSIRNSYLYNNSLLHLRINIGDFSSKINGVADYELTTIMLNELDDIFTKINDAGSCVIVRFAYTYDDIKNIEPEISMILKHIEQFTPLINKHKNMITAVECGLVGPWGEMHSSTIANQTTYNKLLDKYLHYLDNDVKLLVRRPKFIYEYYGLTIKTLDKFDFENNRLGCYNDGYLGSSSDLGTFVDREKEIAFLEKINQNNPYGGEVTVPDSTYNHLTNACEEMFRTNLSYLNIKWNNQVIDRWKNTIYSLNDPLYQGQTEFKYIENHMGYRFVCEELQYSINDNLNIKLKMKNVGFGQLYKTKKIFIILKNSNNQYIFELEYNNQLQITQKINIANIESGEYELFISLADEFTTKAIRGIRFANTNMYNEEIQANKLTNIMI